MKMHIRDQTATEGGHDIDLLAVESRLHVVVLDLSWIYIVVIQTLRRAFPGLLGEAVMA